MLNWFITSPIPLGIVLVLYLIQAIGYAKLGDSGLAIAFGAYALANVGFIINLLGLR